jgi:ABC-type nitrate/sulfonate/bicarbonate transport system substrate-binding protein
VRVLLVKAIAWIVQHPEAREIAASIVKQLIEKELAKQS